VVETVVKKDTVAGGKGESTSHRVGETDLRSFLKNEE